MIKTQISSVLSIVKAIILKVMLGKIIQTNLKFLKGSPISFHIVDLIKSSIY